jgi:hypothetical protein
MILIELVCNSDITETWLKRFVTQLYGSVAMRLSVYPQDVEVAIRRFSTLDIHRSDIRITVSDERGEIAQEKQLLIVVDLKPLLNKRLFTLIDFRSAKATRYGFHGTIDDCAEAKRLFGTIQHGNDLAQESEFWLKNHISSCETCRPTWEAVQTQLLRG